MLFFDNEDKLWVHQFNLYEMDPETGATSIVYAPNTSGIYISNGVETEIPQKSHGAFDRSTGVYWDIRTASREGDYAFTKYDISTGKQIDSIAVPNTDILPSPAPHKAPSLAFANDNNAGGILNIERGTTFINDQVISLGTNRGHVINNQFIGGGFDNYGIIDSYHNIEGGFTNHESGVMNVVGYFHPLFSTVENYGMINLLPSVGEYPSTEVQMMDGTFNNHGVYRIDTPVKSGGTLNNHGIFEITPRGSYEINSFLGFRQKAGGQTIVNGVLHNHHHLPGLAGGTLSGNGIVISELGIVGGREDFTISPGSPIGTLTLKTPWIKLAARRSLDIELAGTDTQQYDRLVIAGGGVIYMPFGPAPVNVLLREGFIPQAGDRFEIIKADFHTSGREEGLSFNFPSLPDGLTWDVEYTDTSVILKVI